MILVVSFGVGEIGKRLGHAVDADARGHQ